MEALLMITTPFSQTLITMLKKISETPVTSPPLTTSDTFHDDTLCKIRVARTLRTYKKSKFT